MNIAAKPVERVRGQNLEVFIKRANGVPFVEAIIRADGADRVIASNNRMGKALIASDEWKSIEEVFGCWTGTIAGYVEPKTAFNKSKMFSRQDNALIYVDPETKQRWIFPVREEHRRKKNAILVAEHPDYKLEVVGGDILVAANADLVPKFPGKDGWYLTDSVHGIPVGKEINSSNKGARYLWRVDDSGRAGPVARGYIYNGCIYIKGIGLSLRPSGGLGVAVESVGAPTDARNQKVAVEAPDVNAAQGGIAPIVRNAEQSGGGRAD